MDFAIWDESIHEHPDQKKRIASALTAKVTPVSIDKDNQTGIFSGSGKKPYNTTLTYCTCIDFSRRKIPCKHMYRLAVELGLVDATVASDEKYTHRHEEAMLKEEAKKYLNTMNQEKAEVFYHLFYDLQHKDYIIYQKSDCPRYIFEHGIFEEINDDIIKLQKLKKCDLIELCPVKLPKSSAKKVYIDTILENKTDNVTAYCDSLVIVGVNDKYKNIVEALKRYVLKLYPDVKLDWSFIF